LPSRRQRGRRRKTISKKEKHKQYARFAVYCLMAAAGDPACGAIQREMATEWIRLAEALIRKPEPSQ
jgi:hypothetical protein